MAATAFFKINNGFGLKRINNEGHLTKTQYAQRNSSIFPPLQAVQRPSSPTPWTKKCYNTPSNLLRLKQEHTRPRIILKCRAEVEEVELLNNAPVENYKEEEEEIPRSTLLWRAAKLPMYTVALIPVTVGAAVAYWQTGQFSVWRYFVSLASYVIVNVWVNLSNDVYDFDTGADKDKKESVVNLFGSRNLINGIAWSLLVLGFLGFISVAVAAKNPRSLVLMTFAAFCFFLYQCPPFRLSYYGVGEPLLLTAYGPLSTIAFYLLHSRTSELPISGTIIWSSILIGFTTALILFCSHFHQIEGDKAAGKMSPLVRLGTENGSRVVKFGVIGLYSLVLSLGICQTLPLASVILCAMTLPVANAIVGFVEKNHKDKTKIFMSKYYFVRLHTIFGIALTAGLVVARLLAKQPLQQAIMV